MMKRLKNLSLWTMSALLTMSGIHHLMDPFSLANAIPLFIPFKSEILFTTGIFEIFLGFLVLVQQSRPILSNVLTAYFSFLIIIHIHVSIYKIPMFGLTHPALHWGRTLFQLLLIRWAYSMRNI